uniref:PSI domain-containing protein n=1 Tax=Rhabditophanes sp. KR3021 TaxID=114890 RepID=A0AC35TR43_9BILA
MKLFILINLVLTTSCFVPYQTEHSIHKSSENGPEIKFIGRGRAKRDVLSEGFIDNSDELVGDDGRDFNLTDWEVPKEFDKETAPTDHIYYEVITYSENQTAFDQYYVDVKKMLDNNAEGHALHPQLHNSYRKAVGAKLNSSYPYYGHELEHITIATGGFCYLGDKIHAWLAATQYVAPLMANFDTESSDSTILYADDTTKFVVEWKNVRLRDRHNAGKFSFEMALYKNGDIHFVYDKVPIPILNISEAQHPVKIGISDAYISETKSEGAGGESAENRTTAPPKRIIYEYHRISIPETTRIGNKTVILIKAKPSCIMINDCKKCFEANLEHFQCSWCSNEKTGEGFCSDKAGLHRKRHQFIQNQCHKPKANATADYCKATNTAIVKPTTTSDQKSTTTKEATKGDKISTTTKSYNEPSAEKKSSIKKNEETSILSFLFVSLLVFLTLGSIWVLYAYYNPQSSSGQFLIKYRFSEWKMPDNHVRYTSALHT